MKIAITGGTGFIGGHLAKELVAQGHSIVIIARGHDSRKNQITALPRSTFFDTGIDSPENLSAAFTGCNVVVHCAGINREHGDQTYQKVHIKGTQNVIDAAKRAGIEKIIFLSFLRARPNCGSGYHESKFAGEELVRNCGLDYSVIKEGITYGNGDHMVSHLSWALSTIPVFAAVGLKEKLIRPIYVNDLTRILTAAAIEGRLSRQTVAVMGPEAITLTEAVERVAEAIGRRPLMVTRLPVWAHNGLARIWEKVMSVPLVSRAQVRMLAEGLDEPAPSTQVVPEDLAPRTRFNKELISQIVSEAARKRAA